MQNEGAAGRTPSILRATEGGTSAPLALRIASSISSSAACASSHTPSAGKSDIFLRSPLGTECAT